MKRVININLGGLPFIIDEDAYEYMENYLNSIRKHFSFSESKDEIMYDIEMRMSELFQEKLRSKQIITMTELDSVIQIMSCWMRSLVWLMRNSSPASRRTLLPPL